MIWDKLFAALNKTPRDQKEKSEGTGDAMLAAVSDAKLCLKKLNTKQLFEGKELLVFGAENAPRCAYFATTDASGTVLIGEEKDRAAAERLLHEKAPGKPFLYLSEPACSLPYPRGCFDTVFLDGILEREEEPADLLAEAVRLCRSGGYICLSYRPHLAPFGDGLTDIVSLPHAHLLFPERVLVNAYREKLGTDPLRFGEKVKTNERGCAVLRHRPKLSTASLHGICGTLPLQMISETKLPTAKALSFLTSLPFAGDLCTDRVVSVWQVTDRLPEGPETFSITHPEEA